MKHVVVIPYHSYSEIKRYLQIAGFLKQFTVTKSDYEFFLAASFFTKPSPTLFNAFSHIAPVKIYSCRRKIKGFPEGPCAMFWEIMQYINESYEKDGGFVLWFESDMIPVKKDWIDRLAREWMIQQDTVLMGSYIPKIYKKTRLYCREHINGGACYAKDLVNFVPQEARIPAFDANLFPYLKETKRVRRSKSVAFAHRYNLWQSIYDPEKTILHGFKLNKDKFIHQCIKIIQNPKLEKEKILIQKIVPTRLRRCCSAAYWSGFSFRCPVHQVHSLKTVDSNKQKLKNKSSKRTFTDKINFYIFYHDEKSFSSIRREEMPENFNLVDLRILSVPEELRIPELTIKQNRDIFSESLALLQLNPSSDMVGLFPYSIPLKFSHSWAKKTNYYHIFLPPIKFSAFFGKSFDRDKLYGVEFVDFWNLKSRIETATKKYIKQIHHNSNFRVGGNRINKGPFKNAVIVKTETFLAFQQWFRGAVKYILDKYGWDVVDTSEQANRYDHESFHAHLSFSEEQKLIDITLRHKLSALLERLFSYYFGQKFSDKDKVDLRFFKGI